MDRSVPPELGDEAVERIQRSRALYSHPRPLSADERMVLRETVAPVLRDLRTTGAILPDIQEHAREERSEEAVSAWIQSPGGASGMGIWIRLASPAAERVAELAGQLPTRVTATLAASSALVTASRSSKKK